MARIAYIKKKFRADSAAIIKQADDIMREYAGKGFSLTLRQLYYQFVARGLMENLQKNYARLGGIVSDARMAGLLDWSAIEDRTRGIESLSKWSNPGDIMQAVAQQYRIDLWAGQLQRPEVWIEKEALVGVVEPVCNQHRVDYLACRGYLSASECWRAGQRIIHRWRQTGQETLILHFGDHDPSGIDMTRDNRQRLEVFCMHHLGRTPFEFKRIALNMDQVLEHNPPPNPAKMEDSRFGDYLANYGEESWELDALDPETITALIEDEIGLIVDTEIWEQEETREEAEKANLALVSANFDAAVEALKKV